MLLLLKGVLQEHDVLLMSVLSKRGRGQGTEKGIATERGSRVRDTGRVSMLVPHGLTHGEGIARNRILARQPHPQFLSWFDTSHKSKSKQSKEQPTYQQKQSSTLPLSFQQCNVHIYQHGSHPSKEFKVFGYDYDDGSCIAADTVTHLEDGEWI